METEESNENVQVVAGQDETGQPVQGQEGETAQVAAVPEETTGETPQNATGTEEPGPVPYDRFKEVNDRMKAAEQQAAQLQQFMMQQQQPQQPQGDPFQQFIEQQGIGQDGFVSPDDLRKVGQFFQQQQQQTLQQQQQETWLAAHPDYVGVVTTPTGQPSEQLMNAIKNDPALGVSLKRNWDPVLAYHAAKAYTPTQPSVNPVQQIKSGQVAPQGISAATGGGGQTDTATMVQGMSNEEFQTWWQGQRRV